MLTLYDAARCPYCARVRIVLAEKEIELRARSSRPRRPAGVALSSSTRRRDACRSSKRTAFVLPESAVIMEYLEERFPEPAAAPRRSGRPGARAALGSSASTTSATRTTTSTSSGRPGSLERSRGSARGARPAARRSARTSPAREYGLADIAYVPWILRAETRLGLDLAPFESLVAWRRAAARAAGDRRRARSRAAL